MGRPCRFFRIVERVSPAIEALGVLAIPFVLFFAGQQYQEKLQQQATESQQQQVVKDYLNQLSTVLLEVEGDLGDLENERLRALTEASTLTLLREPDLDGKRKGQVIAFLSAMNLIKRDIVYGPLPLGDKDEVPILDLSNSDLSRIYLVGTNLSQANLRYADLSNASTFGIYFPKANLRAAKLKRAYLAAAYLIESDLTYADLTNANLKFADLFKSTLDYADLNKALLFDTDLGGVDLRKVRNVTQKQLAVARLCNTQLPEGIDLNPDRDCTSSTPQIIPNPPRVQFPEAATYR